MGPLLVGGRNPLLCPVCDDDRVSGIPPDVERVCSLDHLTGLPLVGAIGSVRGLTAQAFETDPCPSSGPERNRTRRFFYYTTCAVALGVSGERADLPGCVRDRIEELYGQSETGFVDA